MEIREYPTKDLVYHFVLFYDLPENEMLKYRIIGPHMPDDNAILTYCYIDREAGLSYEVICTARRDNLGNVTYREPGNNISLKIREGGLISQALVFAEGGELAGYQDRADIIKENYGYNIKAVKAIEAKPFPDRRHVCYPNDVMVTLFGEDMKPELIWVRDIDENDYPEEIRSLAGTNAQVEGDEMYFVSAGRLINEPYDSGYGYHNGSIVPVFAFRTADGRELPIVPAYNMWSKK